MALQMALDGGEPPGPAPSAVHLPPSSPPGAVSYATMSRLGLAAPSGPIVGGGNPESSPPASLGKWGQSSATVREAPPSLQPKGGDNTEPAMSTQLPSRSGPLAMSLRGAQGGRSPLQGAWSGGMPKGRRTVEDRGDDVQRKNRKGKQQLKGFFE
jgi:hypothetical protein